MWQNTKEYAIRCDVMPVTHHAYYVALKYCHQYPQLKFIASLDTNNQGSFVNARITQSYFQKQIRPALERMYEVCIWKRPEIIRWEDRCEGYFGDWNHAGHFDDVFTYMCDGYPVYCWQPKNWKAPSGIGGADLLCTKYVTAAYKGHLYIGFHGLIVAHVGPCGGTECDVKIWKDAYHKYPMYPGEMALGDKIYGGCPQVLCGKKIPTHRSQPALTVEDRVFNELVSHYRARVEIVINRLKNHNWCKSTFRGSLTMMGTFMEIAVVFTALEIRREIEAGQVMFEVVGPWPHAF
jgi:hypothetical protein